MLVFSTAEEGGFLLEEALDALDHEETVRRVQALRWLISVRPQGWICHCLRLAVMDESIFVRGEATAGLDQAPPQKVAQEAVQLLDLSWRGPRRRGAALLRRLPASVTLEVLGVVLEGGTARARQEAVQLLGRLPQAGSALLGLARRALRDPLPSIRRKMIRLLERLAQGELPEVGLSQEELRSSFPAQELEKLLQDPEPSVRRSAFLLARALNEQADALPLLESLRQPGRAREEALLGLVSTGMPESLLEETLPLILNEGSLREKRLALHVLAQSRSPGALKWLCSLLASEEEQWPQQRLLALWALGRHRGTRESLSDFSWSDWIDDPAPRMRAAALRLLERKKGFFSAGETRSLEKCLADPDEGVAWKARSLLASLSAKGGEASEKEQSLASEKNRAPKSDLTKRAGNSPAKPEAPTVAPSAPKGDPVEGAGPPNKSPEPGGLRGSPRIRNPIGLPRHEGPLPQERSSFPLAVAILSPSFQVNAGVLIRSAEAAGAQEVFLVGKADYHVESARGTDGFLNLRHLPSPWDLLDVTREAGYQLVIVQQTPQSLPFQQIPYPPRPLFLLGNEDQGVPPWLCQEADLLIEIPLFGAIDSLNVACAGTLVLFEWLRQQQHPPCSPPP